jgi:membrane-associated phospholipid phosphatase
VTKILAVLLWPAGIALILGAGALLARRAAPAVPGGHELAATAAPAREARPAAAAAGGARGFRPAIRSAAVFLLAVIAGAMLIYGLMALLGLLVVHAGPAIDKPVEHWTTAHRMHAWAAVMNRATKIGDTWTTWGAVTAAAVCLAVGWHKNRWLPPLALGAAIVVDHYTTQYIRHTFERPGPPGSPLGTFPSGGCDRVVFCYGLIAYLLWHEFSRQRRAGIWAGTAVAALAFSEGYSRAYLTLHWLTDILSGWVFGSLLLLLFVTAVRYVDGGRRRPGGPGRLGGLALDAVREPAAGISG